jgi:hypothetical protein
VVMPGMDVRVSTFSNLSFHIGCDPRPRPLAGERPGDIGRQITR